MTTSVDIVIPVLNEQGTLEKNINIILDFIEKNLSKDYQCQIIIADNGSIDDTPSIAKKIEQSNNGKVLYHRVDTKGVGLALKTAWSKSKSDIVGYMDLDLATDLNHLPDALYTLAHDDYDVVYGTRLHKNSKVHGRKLKRAIVSRVFNLFMRRYLSVNISDGMCGFKFLKNEKLPLILNKGAKSDGWFFCTEILVVAEWNGQKLYELPVKWTDDPDSKANIKNLTIEYLKAMKTLKKNRGR